MASGMDTDIDHWGIRKAATVSQHFLWRFACLEFVKNTLGFPLSDVSQTVSEVSSYIFRPPGPKPPIRHQLLMFLHFGCRLLLAFYFCFSEAAWQLEDVLHDVNIEVYPDKPRSSGTLNHADSTKMWFDGGKLKRVLTCGESLRLNLEPILKSWNMFFCLAWMKNSWFICHLCLQTEFHMSSHRICLRMVCFSPPSNSSLCAKKNKARGKGSSISICAKLSTLRTKPLGRTCIHAYKIHTGILDTLNVPDQRWIFLRWAEVATTMGFALPRSGLRLLQWFRWDVKPCGVLCVLFLPCLSFPILCVSCPYSVPFFCFALFLLSCWTPKRWQEMTRDKKRWEEMRRDEKRWEEMRKGEKRWEETRRDEIARISRISLYLFILSFSFLQHFSRFSLNTEGPGKGKRKLASEGETTLRKGARG